IERGLREGLTRADRAAAAARPALRHLLAGADAMLLSDETVARVRGLLGDAARQLLAAQAEAAALADAAGFAAERAPALAARMADNEAWLGHVHALALEGELLERLRLTRGLDPVLTPRIERLAASGEALSAALATAVLAAQARFVHHHRRRELALCDLPDELYDTALALLGQGGPPDAAVDAEQQLRVVRADSRTRPALLEGFALLRGGEGLLEIDNAGLSLFASALAAATGRQREATIVALAASSPDRAALMLCAAGLSAEQIEAQMAWLQPEPRVPHGLAELPAERAAALLDGAADEAAGVIG
ncbi:MAG: hypothetical protein ABIP41_10200, partial [Croceibacterium sp.]